jgi:hypothetical protein
MSWRALQAKCSHLDHRPSAGLLFAGVTGTPPQPERARCRTATRYGGAVDVGRAADLYGQGRTLRQIGAELGVHWSTVSEQLRTAGVTMRRCGPPVNPAALDAGQPFRTVLRDLGLSSNKVFGLARTDPDWSQQLEAGLTASRREDLEHGTNAAYLRGCVCSDYRTHQQVRMGRHRA